MIRIDSGTTHCATVPDLDAAARFVLAAPYRQAQDFTYTDTERNAYIGYQDVLRRCVALRKEQGQ